MRSPSQKRETQAGGPGLLKSADEWCKPFLANPRRIVNAMLVSGLLFGRNLILDGLAGLGWPWSRRLSLWIDALDQAAEMLRDRQGARL